MLVTSVNVAYPAVDQYVLSPYHMSPQQEPVLKRGTTTLPSIELDRTTERLQGFLPGLVFPQETWKARWKRCIDEANMRFAGSIL